VTGICTVAEVKLQLGKSGSTDDTELQSYIDSVTAPIEHLCGPVLQATESEWHLPSTQWLFLRKIPLVSITTVTGYEGTTERTFTACTSPADAGVFTYLLEAGQGKLTRLSTGGSETCWPERVKVVYTTGYATVPADLNLAARIIVQHLWRTQNGGAGLPSISDEAPVEVEGFGYAIPQRARELLMARRRMRPGP
jgi:hypothetical protein